MNTGTKILLILGLLGIVAGIIVYFEASSFQERSKIAEGIVENSRMSSYHVIYTSDDGARHDKYISRKNNGKRDGEKVRVFYLADNPDRARTGDGKKGGKNIVIISICVLLFDLYMIYNNGKNKKTVDNFRTNGRKVQAEITGVDIDTETTIKGKHPYFIKCRWSDPITGKEYTHAIKYIWKDPAPLLAGRTTIDVYIDRDNPEKYFVDTDFLGIVAI